MQKTVTVEAYSSEQAKNIVSERWRNNEYKIDADPFRGIKFETLYGERIIEPRTR